MIGGIDLALDHSDANLFDSLYRVWQKRRQSNLVRSTYFDGEAALKDFGISLPPQMRSISAALGWTAKGVRGVTDRSKFEGFVSASGDLFGVDEIAFENNFDEEFPGAKVSSAVHGCSFLSVSEGDVQSGEPAIQVIARAADSSAAIWDARKRALAGFLSIVELSGYGQPSRMVMYTPSKVVTLTRVERVWGASWKAEIIPNRLGRVSVTPLVYGRELNRPLGHSRITRASMGYSDSALRTIVRAEVSSEFYSAPEYFLFGADVSGFAGDDKWSALMGRIKAWDYSPDDGEPKPDLHRFTGASPHPHTDQLRMWANLFADDQDLEVKFADSSNPTSADAIFAAKETLITTTRDANSAWQRSAERAMGMAVMLRDGLDALPPEMRGLSASHTDPAIVSPSARAAAFAALAQNMTGFGESEVGMEYAGLSREQILRLQSERRRGSDRSMLQMLIGGGNGESGAVGGVAVGAGGDPQAG